MTGNEPDPAEMPVEYGDFLLETQKVFELYNMLDTRYSMEGSFIGKSIVGIEYLIRVLNLPEEFVSFYISIIRLLDELNIKRTQEQVTQGQGSSDGKEDG